MLRIYICPKCYNYRMVSRKPDAICFHCGTHLDKCDLDYIEYMDMTEEARNTYRDDYKKRLNKYSEKVGLIYKERTNIE